MRIVLVVSLVAASVLAAPSASSAPPAPGLGSATAQVDGGHGTDHGQPPIAVAPVAGELVRDFDPPAQPWNAGHRGVALAAVAGDTVVAAMDGMVTFSGEVARRGWVTVDHGDGLVTTYGSLEPRVVAAGQAVSLGDPLGSLAPGAADLHWGARLDGDYIHPLSLLGRWQVRLVPADGS